jgi:hypothetical protein
MAHTNHDDNKWAGTAVAALLQRLALQGAAELMDAALSAYLAAEAMARGER